MQKRSGVRRIRSPKSGKRMVLGTKEKRRLTQLALCVGLFLVIFLGKGIAPEGVLQSGQTLLQYIRADTDFKSAFAALGEAFSRGDSVTQSLGNLAREVFGAGAGEQENEQEKSGTGGLAAEAAEQALEELPTYETMLRQLGVTVPAAEPDDGAAEQQEEQEPAVSPTPDIPEYTGPALPTGASMQYADLGLERTVTPVLGVVSSPFGYRDHPVSGEYLFHSGTDLAADSGTPVQAFADGVVDFIGESEAYGLYIQLNHGNGITTFYCHCSALYAQKGEQVSAGQTIAAVGDTGNATGPHLHLELKQDGVLLNPVYYIETES